MAYRIEGLPRRFWEDMLGLSDAELAARGARRVTADRKPGFPCRVSLEDAEPGERLILLNHVSNDVPGPFRACYGIYVQEKAGQPASFRDRTPPVFDGRTLSLRGFDATGDLRAARLVGPGEADAAIRQLLGAADVAEIHAHNAAAGCFAARIVRD